MAGAAPTDPTGGGPAGAAPDGHRVALQEPTSILVHAPRRLLRQALAAAASTLSDARVVAITADPQEALARSAALQPRLALITTAPQDSQAVLLVRALGSGFPATKTVLLANEPSVTLLHQAHEAGASLVLPLAVDLDELAAWVRRLTVQPRRIALASWLRLAAEHAQPKLMPHGVNPPLATQQQRLLQLLAQGKTNAAIGHELGLSDKTVRNHISRMFARLGANTRTEAVLVALSMHLIELPAQPPPAPRRTASTVQQR